MIIPVMISYIHDCAACGNRVCAMLIMKEVLNYFTESSSVLDALLGFSRCPLLFF